MNSYRELRERLPVGQDRFNFLRGAVDFDKQVQDALGQTDVKPNPRVAASFESRVCDYLCDPAGTFGGHALEHLAQPLGGADKAIISDKEYALLHARAAVLAGSMLESLGLNDAADEVYKTAGKLEARRLNYSLK